MLKLAQVHERAVTFCRAFKEGVIGYASGTGIREVDLNPWALFCRHENEVFAAMMMKGGDGRDQTLQLVNMGITVCEPAIVSFAVEAYVMSDPAWKELPPDEGLEKVNSTYERGDFQAMFEAGDERVTECLMIHTCSRLKRTQTILRYRYNPKTWAIEWADPSDLKGAEATGYMIDYIQNVWEKNDVIPHPMRRAIEDAPLFDLTPEIARQKAFEIGCEVYANAAPVVGTYEEVMGLQMVERMNIWRKARGSG